LTIINCAADISLLCPASLVHVAYLTVLMRSALLKPNSITLADSELVRSWFESDSVMEFGFYYFSFIFE